MARSRALFNGCRCTRGQRRGAGDSTGPYVGDVWFVRPAGDVSLGANDQLGPFLVGSYGHDALPLRQRRTGVSNCTGTGGELAAAGVEAGTSHRSCRAGRVAGPITRDDAGPGDLYDMPLYYWVRHWGRATPRALCDYVWFVVQPQPVAAGVKRRAGLVPGGAGRHDAVTVQPTTCGLVSMTFTIAR